MPELPQRKAGIVACSGEELAEGTVSRLAALKVLQELRPGHTVTICLPLFLAGGEGDRAFARVHPTITIDGCELRCAARGTEMYSGKPAASIVVNDLAAQQGLGKIEGRRQLNAAGKRAVEIAAGRLAELVDEVLGRPHHPAHGGEITEPAPQQTRIATCSCGSGIPVGKITIDGNAVEIVALPLIFQRFHELGRSPDAAVDELLATVKIYNYVAPGAEESFRETIVRAYAAFCEEEAAAQ